jgi:uncharacterized protein with gpF-like domain
VDAKPKTLRAIHPNAGWEQRYKRSLLSLIEEMEASVIYWAQAQYRDDPPAMAMDATPSQAMQKRFAEVAKKWRTRWDKAAPKIAQAYLRGSYKSTDSALMAALRDAGISVKFKMTAAVRDAFQAQLAENVTLIKNLPEQYLAQVQGVIQRSYSSGFDLQKMVRGIRKETGVSQRRAVTISRDQSNKAHAAIERARRLELGFTDALWIHSGGGKHPRPEHVKAGAERRRYKIADGCPIPDSKGIIRKIQPGEEINCRCVSRAVLPGL